MENTSLPKKSDLELHQEAIRRQNALKPTEAPLTAKDLKKDLIGSFDDRMKEVKTIHLTLSYGQRPEVEFGGFWNGKLVNNAMNAISRAYRLQRHKSIRTGAQVPTTLEAGDGNNK